MLTEKETTLIADLKFLNADMEIIEIVMDEMETEEQRELMINSLKKRYHQKGEVTREDIVKLILMILKETENPQKQ